MLAAIYHERPPQGPACPVPGCPRQRAWSAGGHWFGRCGHHMEALRLATLRLLGWSESRIAETLPGFTVCDEPGWARG